MGASRVARLLAVALPRLSAEATLQPAQVNGYPALIVRINGEVDTVLAVRIDDGLVSGLYAVRNPEKLSHMERETIPAPLSCAGAPRSGHRNGQILRGRGKRFRSLAGLTGVSQENAELTAAHGAADAGPPPQVMVAVDRISRTFGSGHTAVHALRGVSFTVGRGQLTALRGRSGSGKTTLLNIIGGLDSPTSGQVWVDGREVGRMAERERLALRRDTVAFIFQSFGLIPMLSAAENVGIPLRIAGMRPSERRERIAAMLALVGLSSHAAHRPNELSGGQQQRVGHRPRAGQPTSPADR